MMKTNVSPKNSELIIILDSQFKGMLNLARIKFIALFISSLCKVQTVNFEKLANAFDSGSKATSSLRRVQRFISGFTLESDLIAKIIFSLLPKKDKYTLTIDRTNWKFGNTNINIFMLGVVYKGVAFPLLFSMLDKKGNSNSKERIDLIERYIRLFSENTIDCLVADREFVGHIWIKYLNNQNIRYYIRIRNNFKVFLPHKNQMVKVFWLFHSYRINEFTFYNKIVRINDQLCYLSGSKLHKGEYFILVSFNKPEQADFYYKQRWQIEMSFKAMKSSGFDIEKTHLQNHDRIRKLLLLVMIAFVWCYKVGIHLHSYIKPIKTKKHGRKAKSIFKYGLSYVASILLNDQSNDDIGIFKFLSCT